MSLPGGSLGTSLHHVAQHDLDTLLRALPATSAERAARWLLWSIIVRRWILTLAPVGLLLMSVLR
jgi:hypothetical protein